MNDLIFYDELLGDNLVGDFIALFLILWDLKSIFQVCQFFSWFIALNFLAFKFPPIWVLKNSVFRQFIGSIELLLFTLTDFDIN